MVAVEGEHIQIVMQDDDVEVGRRVAVSHINEQVRWR